MSKKSKQAGQPKVTFNANAYRLHKQKVGSSGVGKRKQSTKND